MKTRATKSSRCRSRNTHHGYGILEGHAGRLLVLDYGCIRPPNGDILSVRYRIIYEESVLLWTNFQPMPSPWYLSI